MNSCDRSLEDGPSVVTKAFPCISPVIPGHFYWFYQFYGGRSLDSVGGLQRSLKKIYVVFHLMEGWIEYLDEYNYKYLYNYQKLTSIVPKCRCP